eukprot:gnl/TRDRNA2_/TRDRNA2_38532_c0_seq2.p1 gnl/TRDRNA2_/TRDRNA2_38532_c0~~gnl/TRDRNA2_/TRDRNA2_38532_c0_seq2.p1  ORF type:complete len:327 (+),score=60.83 gnl/TRDRNA2_/TRDRNA2_38532_c0_seq2:75-1055(+)
MALELADMFSAFEYFCSEGQHLLDMRGFARLCKACNLVNKMSASAEADVVFTQVVPKGHKHMRLMHFDSALDVLAKLNGISREEVCRAVRDLGHGCDKRHSCELNVEATSRLQHEEQGNNSTELENAVTEADPCHEEMDRAARQMQRIFRGHQTRRHLFAELTEPPRPTVLPPEMPSEDQCEGDLWAPKKAKTINIDIPLPQDGFSSSEVRLWTGARKEPAEIELQLVAEEQHHTNELVTEDDVEGQPPEQLEIDAICSSCSSGPRRRPSISGRPTGVLGATPGGVIGLLECRGRRCRRRHSHRNRHSGRGRCWMMETSCRGSSDT